MVEHLLCKQGVSGSNPLTSTNWRSDGSGCNRLERDVREGIGGRGALPRPRIFENRIVRHLRNAMGR